MIYPNLRLFLVFRSTIRSSLNLSTVAESNLAKLRRKTGFSFVLCKKALEICNNDLEASAAYLEEESIKQGYVKATKLQTRKAVQGLVGVYLDQQIRRCALLELNCETDFVARNSNFIELTSQLTRELMSSSFDVIKPTRDNQITRTNISTEGSQYFKDRISQSITKLGENIKLSRSLILQFDSNDLLAFHHAHSSGEYIPDQDGVKLGKYGTAVFIHQVPIVPKEKTEEIKPKNKPEEMKSSKVETEKRQLTDEEIDNEEIEFEFVDEQPEYTTTDIGKILCNQIIGMKPLYLTKPSEQTGKGKTRITDDEILLKQKIIVDPSLSVADFCADHGIQVVDFVRIECGDSEDQ